MLTVLADYYVAARVEHHCQFCFRTIEPGESYHRQRNVLDGRAYTFKACAHCQAFAQLSEIYEWADDDGATFHEFIAYEPRNITEARWRAHWKRQWRRRDGSLYPVPDRADDTERSRGGGERG